MVVAAFSSSLRPGSETVADGSFFLDHPESVFVTAHDEDIGASTFRDASQLFAPHRIDAIPPVHASGNQNADLFGGSAMAGTLPGRPLLRVSVPRGGITDAVGQSLPRWRTRRWHRSRTAGCTSISSAPASRSGRRSNLDRSMIGISLDQVDPFGIFGLFFASCQTGERPLDIRSGSS